MAYACADNNVYIVDAVTGEMITKLIGHTRPVRNHVHARAGTCVGEEAKSQYNDR